MNVVKSLIERVEERLTETKNPCKNYATEEAAEKATAEIAWKTAVYFTQDHDIVRSTRYIVVYIESWGRWVGAIDMTELLSRKNRKGGYIGFCSDKGFYCY